MKKLKITYHDGAIQICTPVQDGPNKFNGDWKKLAETVAGRMYPTTHSYKSYEVIG